MGSLTIPCLELHTIVTNTIYRIQYITSDTMLHFYLIIFAIFLCVIIWTRNQKPSNFPPGPLTLPLIGSLLSVGLDLKSAFQKWHREWGDIVGFKLGNKLAVVINDYDILQEAYKDSRISSRPDNLEEIFTAYFATNMHEQISGGIAFSHGETWREQRRFSMKTLKEFGAGKTVSQPTINDEVAKLVEELKQENGKLINLKFRTNLAVVNTLWQILNGEKSDSSNPEMVNVFRKTAEFITENSMTGPIMIKPWLRHLPYFKTQFEKARSSPQTMRRLTSASIKKHVESYDEEHQRDFIVCYLKKMSETTDESSSFHSNIGEGNMQRTLMDIFGAGSETTSAVLIFAFNYLTRYPEIQERVQKEIDTVIGSRAPELTDRQMMPYTDAVIHEVLRHSCIIFTTPHATTEKVTFHGFTLPKGTQVFANVSAIMNDPQHWDNPHQFNPDRFIDDEGNFRKNDRCIPFLVGKRYCIGQQLAQHELFLFLTGLLQAFTFCTPLPHPNMVNIDPVVGFMHTCPDYTVHIHSRT